MLAHLGVAIGIAVGTFTSYEAPEAGWETLLSVSEEASRRPTRPSAPRIPWVERETAPACAPVTAK